MDEKVKGQVGNSPARRRMRLNHAPVMETSINCMDFFGRRVFGQMFYNRSTARFKMLHFRNQEHTWVSLIQKAVILS